MQQSDVLQNTVHTFRASEASGRLFAAAKKLCGSRPRIHCLTNAVTMREVANILLAVGGSAIMAQCAAEAAEITELCHGTLLNTGTPSDEKFNACRLAGVRANALGHPVVLDPVGAGASAYRRENMRQLLSQVHPELIRCNLEEALTLLRLAKPASALSAAADLPHGGVESGIDADMATRCAAAAQLAKAYRTTVLISGGADIVSDGARTAAVAGGDSRIPRITGSGCMLSAICAAFLCAEKDSYDAALDASVLWKQAAAYAGEKTDRENAGLGSFYTFLFDAVNLNTSSAEFILCRAPSESHRTAGQKNTQ